MTFFLFCAVSNTHIEPGYTLTHVAKSLINRDGPRAPIAVCDPLGIKFHPLEKAIAFMRC
jgi:hypothetical protein